VDVDVREWEKKGSQSGGCRIAEARGRHRERACAVAQQEKFCVAEVENGDGKLLQSVADALKQNSMAQFFCGKRRSGCVSCKRSGSADVEVSGDKIIQEMRHSSAGKGGGRPENAQGAAPTHQKSIRRS